MASVIARVLEICQTVAEAGVQTLILKEVCLLPASVRLSVSSSVRLSVSEAKVTPKFPSPFLANGTLLMREAELNVSSAQTGQAVVSKGSHTLRVSPFRAQPSQAADETPCTAKAAMMHKTLLAAGLLSAQAAASRMACDADLLLVPEAESFVMCSSTQLGLRMRLSKAATKFLENRRFSVDGSPAAAMQPLLLLHLATHKASMQLYQAGGLTIFQAVVLQIHCP